MSPRARLRASAKRTFLSLRTSRNFRLYLFGQLVSATGTWVNATASAWLVLQLTHSGVALGVNVALLFLPILLLGAWGGVLADRYDKRRILIWTQSAFAATAFVMFTIVAAGVVQLWMVYVLSVIAGAFMALDNPTRQSFYAEMVGEDAVTNAVSLNSAAFTGSRILGPALAGALIATVGIQWPFLLDGLSFLAVILALVLMRPAEFHVQPRSTRSRGHMKAGLQYTWRTDELRRPLIAMAVVFTFSLNFAVLLPLLAKRTFGGDAGTFGALSALAGLGSFLGAMVLANRDRRPTMHRLAIFSVATGLALVTVGLAPVLPVALFAMILVGFAVMAFMITGNTILQLNAVPQARGRVMALYGIVFLGSTPIGSPIAGWIAELNPTWGPRLGLVGGGAAALAMGLGLLWHRRRTAEPEAVIEDLTDVPIPAAAG
jgi:MFS family permease